MRPPDLPSAEQLGRNKPHGHKMRYMAGCRCRRCRLGNAAYENNMKRDRELYGPNDLVPVDRVRSFLHDMQKLGIGYITIARHVGVAKTPLGEILWPGKADRGHIRRRTEAKVLAYRPTLDTMPKNLNIPAGETIEKIRQLIRWGYPKTVINRDGLGLRTIGLQCRALEGKTPHVLVKTALRIRDFFALIAEMRAVWIKAGGPIPPHHFVYWKRKPGPKVTLKALGLRPFSVNYSYFHLYPPELKSAMRLRNQLERELRNRRKNGTTYKEPHPGSSRSSLRDPGSLDRQREANGAGPRAGYL